MRFVLPALSGVAHLSSAKYWRCGCMVHKLARKWHSSPDLKRDFELEREYLSIARGLVDWTRTILITTGSCQNVKYVSDDREDVLQEHCSTTVQTEKEECAYRMRMFGENILWA